MSERYVERERERTGDEILDHEHVGQRTHRHGVRAGSDLGKAGKTVLAVDVHGARTANTLTARSTLNKSANRSPSERESRILLILDLEQSIQHHGSTTANIGKITFLLSDINYIALIMGL